jgi:predicted nucleotidyltransferase
MLGNTELNQDFKEFLQSLNANRVRYLIVGGYAVAIHGHPRYTKDLDIWVDLDEENAAKVVQALIDFGFGSLNLQISDFLEPDTVIQLGYPPSRIDLLIGLDGAAFEECYAKRLEGIVDGIRVCVVDRDGLIRLKEAAGRPQDVADVDKLSS